MYYKERPSLIDQRLFILRNFRIASQQLVKQSGVCRRKEKVGKGWKATVVAEFISAGVGGRITCGATANKVRRKHNIRSCFPCEYNVYDKTASLNAERVLVH